MLCLVLQRSNSTIRYTCNTVTESTHQPLTNSDTRNRIYLPRYSVFFSASQSTKTPLRVSSFSFIVSPTPLCVRITKSRFICVLDRNDLRVASFRINPSAGTECFDHHHLCRFPCLSTSYVTVSFILYVCLTMLRYLIPKTYKGSLYFHTLLSYVLYLRITVTRRRDGKDIKIFIRFPFPRPYIQTTRFLASQTL